ncbi:MULTISPECIES: hypothetical protein [unclassified Streptomyces]|uniref:hypothetical protein n=1 Tax=unclassified Streptomyces TaxID=2593676 RepID=UPI00225776BF|nr:MULTISPECIES: hypothetical protein [unclassified Streptomyces]MCX4528864.1 hypothetical protein [Streptomyces sp. NBC_01551]MCX4540528.1 hypothetical protein [Streptomyces sp. NBC_01565]
MTRVRTTACAALLLGGVLTGCGIKPTGVIESGAAAKVVVPAPDTKAMVYFVAPDGRLVPTTEPYDSVSATNNLLRLLMGPTQRESAAGLETRLPPWDLKKLGASAGMSVVSADTIEVGVPFDVGRLSETGRRQLVCTVASTNPRYKVVLRGGDADLAPARCDLGD